jgi:hypothetical protein
LAGVTFLDTHLGREGQGRAPPPSAALAICRTLDLAHAAFEVAIAEKPAGMFMIRHRTRVVKRHPEGDW